LELKKDVFLRSQEKELFKLVELIFNHCLKRDNVPISYLKEYIEKKRPKKIFKFSDFPLNLLYNSDSKLSSEFLRSVLEGIFLSNPKLNKKKQSDGKEKSAIIFASDISLPRNSKSWVLNLDKQYNVQKFGIPVNTKVIPNSSLLIDSALSDDFFKLISNPPS
jgi:hypothetical protein